MRKFKCFIAFCIIVVLFASCSFTYPKPDEGLWYCEELNISIDFSLRQSTYLCAMLYKDENNPQVLGCHFDYGRGIYIFEESESGNIDHLIGTFQWTGSEFLVTAHSDGYTYVFLERKI